MITLLYDGTFDGLFSAIFEGYELKLKAFKIEKNAHYISQFFDETVEIITDTKKSERVITKLESYIDKNGIRQLLYSFLSEEQGIENTILKVVQYAISSKLNVMQNITNEYVLRIVKLVKSVGREKHRMEAFVRFSLTKDQIYFAVIEPDFDVLLLIKKHFLNRYQDQKWLIYDVKRNYGLYYDLNSVEIVHFENEISLNVNDIYDTSEINYQELWKEYFDHTNIKERKNTKLHLQHVPKRYWKYLTEKN